MLFDLKVTKGQELLKSTWPELSQTSLQTLVFGFDQKKKKEQFDNPAHKSKWLEIPHTSPAHFACIIFSDAGEVMKLDS